MISETSIIGFAHACAVRTATLFGSRVRAGTLETLALTSAPLSAYRVAKVIGAQPIQVLRVLKRLEPGIVRHGPKGWVLTSVTLRQFLREAIAQRDRQIRQEKDNLLVRMRMKPSLEHEPG